MKGLLRQKEGERGKRNEASCALGTPDAPRSPCRPVGLSCCLGPAAEHTYPSDNSIFPLWRQRRNSKFHASGCFPVEVLEKQTRRFWGHARPCPHGGVGHAYDCTPSEPLRADWQLPRHPQRRHPQRRPCWPGAWLLFSLPFLTISSPFLLPCHF